MSANNISQTILIRENTPLPAGLAVESEVFLRGWRVIKNPDRSTLARNIEGANWTFFYLAGEIRFTAWVATGQEPCVGGCEVCSGEAKGTEV